MTPILIANETHFYKLRSLNLRPLVETFDAEILHPVMGIYSPISDLSS